MNFDALLNMVFESNDRLCKAENATLFALAIGEWPMNDGIIVLVVEDEPLILLGMQEALEGGGYVLLTARNGADAIALLDSRHLEIAGVITDIRLGNGPTGWEVARHARGLRSDIAIVYTSGDSAGDWPSEGLPHSL
jgi:DNA-binding NtrC family response regulator